MEKYSKVSRIFFMIPCVFKDQSPVALRRFFICPPSISYCLVSSPVVIALEVRAFVPALSG